MSSTFLFLVAKEQVILWLEQCVSLGKKLHPSPSHPAVKPGHIVTVCSRAQLKNSPAMAEAVSVIPVKITCQKKKKEKKRGCEDLTTLISFFSLYKEQLDG